MNDRGHPWKMWVLTFFLVVVETSCVAIGAPPLTKNAPSVTYNTLPVTCVAGTFTIGSRASVTCLFNKDLNATQQSFSILHYNADDNSTAGTDSGDPVLQCSWGLGDANCTRKDGYIFDSALQIFDSVTLEIAVVSTEHQGLYSCQLLAEGNNNVDICALKLSEPVSTPSNVPFFIGVQDEDFSNKALIGLTAVCLVLFLFACFTIAFLLKRKKKEDCESDKMELHSASDDVESLNDVSSLTMASYLSGAPLKTVTEKHEVGTFTPLPTPPPRRGSTKNAKRVKDKAVQFVSDVGEMMTQTEKQVEPVERWTAEDVKEWLMEVSVERYKSLLVLGMKGPKLLELSNKNEMKKLKLDSSDAKRLREKLADLKLFNDLILREEEYRRRKKEWEMSKTTDPEFADIEIVHE